MKGLAFANGLTMSSTADREYRISGLYLDQASGGAGLVARSYAVGDGLNLTKLSDSIDTTQTQTLTYDPNGRVLTAAGPYGSRTYTYDKVGNRLSEARTVAGTTTSQTYAYPTTSNRLSTIAQGSTTARSFVYDAAGNQTSDTRSGTAYATSINNAGRITQVTVGGPVKANYTYDGLNRLSIRQTLNSTPSGTQHLIHDAWDHILVETNGAGQAVREYVWLGDLPVAVLDGSSIPASPTLLWVHADHLGRPELMTDATKTVKWKAVYEPFGTVSSITGAAANQMRFPGQWFQLEAGLAYNWYRQYDSTIGRYTQPDVLKVGIVSNLYVYTKNNPINNIDSDGKFAIAIPMIVPAAAALGLGTYILSDKIKDLLNGILNNNSNSDGPVRGLPPTGVEPPVSGICKPGPASHPKEQAKGGQSLWDPNGGEWRWYPGDKWHNPHWDHNPHDSPNSPWVNVPEGGLPPVKP